MERRFYLGLGILAVFLILGLAVTWGMERVSTPASQLLEQATEEIVQGNLEEGAALAQKAQRIWEKGWKAVADRKSVV